VAHLRAAGAAVAVLGPHAIGAADGELIQVPVAAHELLQPLVALYAAYPFPAQLARERGRDPDRPPHLEKAVRTRQRRRLLRLSAGPAWRIAPVVSHPILRRGPLSF
jgi:hypothetical protein